MIVTLMQIDDHLATLFASTRRAEQILVICIKMAVARWMWTRTRAILAFLWRTVLYL